MPPTDSSPWKKVFIHLAAAFQTSRSPVGPAHHARLVPGVSEKKTISCRVSYFKLQWPPCQSAITSSVSITIGMRQHLWQHSASWRDQDFLIGPKPLFSAEPRKKAWMKRIWTAAYGWVKDVARAWGLKNVSFISISSFAFHQNRFSHSLLGTCWKEEVSRSRKRFSS